MKARHGFISNSSSSSFILRGVEFKVDKLFKAFGLEKPKEVDEDSDDYTGEDEGLSMIQEYVNTTKKIKLDVENADAYDYSSECESVIIGLPWGDGEICECGTTSINVEKEMTNDDKILLMLADLGLKVEKKDLKLHIFYTAGC